MNQLCETEYDGDSSKLIGGVANKQKVYMYIFKGSNKEDLKQLVNLQNVQQILLIVGNIRNQNQMQNVIEISKQKEGSLADLKLKDLQQYSQDQALYLLQLIHNLYWLNWYYSEEKPDLDKKRRSGLSLNDCVNYSVKAVQSLNLVYEIMLENKYNSKLLTQSIQFQIENALTGTKQQLGILETKGKVKKGKKDKKITNE